MPSIAKDEGFKSVTRLAHAVFNSQVRRPGNIDLSSSGTIVLQTEETLHVLMLAVGYSPLLEPDSIMNNYNDQRHNIPLFHYPLSIQTCPTDTSKVGSGSEAYLNSYEHRFVDARWSPIEMGPLQSPILSALTTQFQIILFHTQSNQFRGPWRQMECLTGGNDKAIVSMTWAAASNSLHAWLLAGTRGGEIIVWSVGGNEVVEKSIHKVVEGEILSVYWSEAGFLAVVTEEEIHILRASRSDDGITFKSNTHQPKPLEGSHISIAKWNGSRLLYCTSGGIHIFEAQKGAQKNFILQNSGEEQSCSFRPAISITPVDDQEWEVLLQDGYQYNITRESLDSPKDLVSPIGYLTPANEIVGTLLRIVESARGLFAKYDDGTGLTYTCHDGNEISSWSHYRESKCQFDLSLTKGTTRKEDMLDATRLIRAALQGDLNHYRTFIVYYIYSSKKSEIVSIVMSLLSQESSEKKQHIQGALRLSLWLQSDLVKDGKEKVKASMYNSILELCLARSLRNRQIVLLELIATNEREVAQQSDNVQYCSFLARAAYVVSRKVLDEELAKASHQVLAAIGQETNTLDKDSIDLGEKCKACRSGIVLQADSILLSKCQKGHKWKRCAASLVVLDTASNRTCSICSHEFIEPSNAKSTFQRQTLESMNVCDLCNGNLFI